MIEAALIAVHSCDEVSSLNDNCNEEGDLGALSFPAFVVSSFVIIG